MLDECQFGVAAKLINVFLKSVLLSEFGNVSENKAKVDAVHPPIDGLLLKKLIEEKIIDRGWQKNDDVADGSRWRGMSPENYSFLIAKIGERTDGELWRIEEYWKGHT